MTDHFCRNNCGHRLSVADVTGTCCHCADAAFTESRFRRGTNTPTVGRKPVPVGKHGGDKPPLAVDGQGRKLCRCGQLVVLHSQCRACHNAANRNRRALLKLEAEYTARAG